MILLSFTESCKWGLVEIESLLMGVMNSLLDFESDRNSFAVIGSFEFSVPSAGLKKQWLGFYVDDESIFIKNKLTNYNIILNYTSVTV